MIVVVYMVAPLVRRPHARPLESMSPVSQGTPGALASDQNEKVPPWQRNHLPVSILNSLGRVRAHRLSLEHEVNAGNHKKTNE